MAIGTFLTIENVIHVKDVNAWIEPSASSNGVINWSMGNDAPKPIRGISKLSPVIQENIADWAVGTSYIRGIVDNYGSITLTDTTRFRDVPLFWGSEYADFKGNGGGSSIMEGVLSCLNLVQVSSEGLMESSKKGGPTNNNVEGDGLGGKASVRDYLQLTVVLAMGRKYLNVDTTTKDGIERAQVSKKASRRASLSIFLLTLSPFVYIYSDTRFRFLRYGRCDLQLLVTRCLLVIHHIESRTAVCSHSASD